MPEAISVDACGNTEPVQDAGAVAFAVAEMFKTCHEETGRRLINGFSGMIRLFHHEGKATVSTPEPNPMGCIHELKG